MVVIPMFDHYKSRMAHRGANMSEMLRMQSNMVIEQTWDRDPNFRRVYVVKISRGLPEVTDKHELIDVKFNVDTYQKAGADEPAYHLQFRHGAEKRNPDIGVGSYVYMADEDGEWKWWLVLGCDERPQFRQYHIAECNYKLGWILDGKIYYHLVVLRSGSSGDVDENSYTSTVDGTLSAWMPTTSDSAMVGYNQRFLISDERRTTPLAWEVSKIEDTQPFGITKIKMKQTTYDETHDNADLMLANYYDTATEPVEPDIEQELSGTASITFSGTKPTVKVGGSWKIFTPVFSVEGTTVDKWLISDENGDISGNTENYTIERDGELLKLKVAANYYLIKKTLIVQVVGSDKSTAQVEIEIVG
jgi:hypothetical protein